MDANTVSALSGIGGAFIGGAATWWAAKTQYETEYKYKKWDALRAVLIELCQNQASLFHDLDRALPAWLARAHRRGGVPLKDIAGYVRSTAIYRTQIYDALFAEVVTTRFGSELVSYYRRLKALNDFTANASDFDPDRNFDDYVFLLAHALEGAIDLARELIGELDKSPIKRWGRNKDIEEVELNTPRDRTAALLVKFDLQNLKAWEEAGALEANLERCDLNTVRAYIAAARGVSTWG